MALARAWSAGRCERAAIRPCRAGRLYALEDASLPCRIALPSLATMGTDRFEGTWKGSVFTAHPKVDPVTNELIGYGKHSTAQHGIHLSRIMFRCPPAPDCFLTHTPVMHICRLQLPSEPIRLGLCGRLARWQGRAYIPSAATPDRLRPRFCHHRGLFPPAHQPAH